ncbi:type 1 glutamine amidotransferase [bacterium]|nr:type 1 glutamine amidotransferase [bacterium]
MAKKSAKKAAKKSTRKSAARKRTARKPRTPRVAVLIENIFEDMEALYPIYRLREAGVRVDVVGPKKNTVYTSKHGYPLKADTAPTSLKAANYDGVIVPGGYAPDKVRRNAKMVKFVSDMNKAGKLMAAICHGGWVFCEADVMRGKTFTSVGAIKTDCVNAGGKFVNREVVVYENLVTSRVPDDLPAFMREILKKLGVS